MTSAERRITSPDNADLRRWQRLARGHATRADGAGVLLEGRHLCEAWLAREGLPQAVIISESAYALDWVTALWQRCAGVQRTLLDDTLARSLSGVGHGPGVFCEVLPPVPTLPARLETTCLCLDRVQDPGNLGTLLRTAAAAGIERAFLSPGCAQAWSPKVLRSGQGAHFALTIHEQVDLQAIVAQRLVPLAVTTLEHGVTLYDADLRAPCAWLFGNEGQGVAPGLLACADVRVHIPQDARVESLNVAAAAAICLFEQRRQQRGR